MVEKLISSNHIEYHLCSTSYSVAEGSSSLNFREKWTTLNRISKLARVNLTHTLRALTSHSQATVGFSFQFRDQCHSPRLQGTVHIPAPVVLQHNFNFQHNLTSYLYEGVGGMYTCRADQLLGLPCTIFTACG
jgi:hypothetical protein